MTTGWQAILAGGLTVLFLAVIGLAVQLSRISKRLSAGGIKPDSDKKQSLKEAAIEESSQVFNNEFREELRNHGRLQFEDTINHNAMFLKQDLDMTIAQLNDYLKKEIGGKMKQEFDDYAQAMADARDLSLDSLRKTANSVEDQRKSITETLQKEVSDREAVLIQAYEENMAKVIEHYILEALGDQFNLKDQLPFIIKQMENNKQAIMEDMRL
jgi:membrane-associated HD superfamily phosphohydrolase